MAKRLMDYTGAASKEVIDVEKEVIKYLKKDIGASYTQGLEVMLADVKSSIEQMSSFKESPVSNQIEIEFYPKILTTGSWPRFNHDDI